MTENSEDPKPWMRQTGERSKAFKLFSTYRDIGVGRSLEKVRQKLIETASDLKVPLRQLAEYSRKNNWVKRAEAWDDYLDEVARSEQELEAKEMVRRQAREAREFQKIAYDMREELHKIEKPTTKAWFLNSIVFTYNTAALLERLNRGEPMPDYEDKPKGLDELGNALENSLKEIREEQEEAYKE